MSGLRQATRDGSSCLRILILFPAVIAVGAPAAWATDFHWTGNAWDDAWYALGATEHEPSSLTTNWNVMGYRAEPPSTAVYPAWPGLDDDVYIDRQVYNDDGPPHAYLQNYHTPSIRNLTVAEDCQLDLHSPLELNGASIVNHGTIEVWQVWGAIHAVGDLNIGGNGTLVSRVRSSSGIFSLPAGAILTNGPGHTIRGSGYLGAIVLNRGTILGVKLSAGDHTNEGLIVGVDFGNVTITNDEGTLRDFQIGNSVIRGGILETTAGKRTLIRGGVIENATLTGEGYFEMWDSHTLKQVTIGEGATVKAIGECNLSDLRVETGASIIGPINGNKLEVNASGTWHNDGEVSFGATITVTDGLVLNGSGQLAVGTLTALPGTIITNGPNHTISRGVIEAALINEGTVSSTAGTNLTGEDKTNAGTIEALTTLNIEDIVLTQTETGRIVADSGELRVVNATIRGGTVRVEQGGLLNLWGATTLDVGPTLVNNGTIQLSDGVTFIGDLDLQGAGELTGYPFRVLNLNIPMDATLRNGPSHTIRGQGTIIGGTLDNLGTVFVDRNSLTIDSPIAQHVGDTLTGGTWIVGGNLNVTTGQDITTNQATVVLDGYRAQFEKINALADNQGSFSLLGHRDFATVGDLTNSGTITLSSRSELTVAGDLEFAEGAALEVVLARPYYSYESDRYRLDASGRINLPPEGEPGASLTLTASGSYRFQAGNHVLLHSDVQEDGLIGRFATTIFNLGAYASADDLVYTSNELLLTIDKDLNPGDADLSTTTDLSDFNIWNANKFTSGTAWTTGDFNGDGTTDLSDFNTWNAHKFTSANGGAAPAPTEVPEPGTLALLLAAMAFTLAYRHRRRN